VLRGIKHLAFTLVDAMCFVKLAMRERIGIHEISTLWVQVAKGTQTRRVPCFRYQAHPLEILFGEELVPKLLGRDFGRRSRGMLLLLLLFHAAVDITIERVAVAAAAAAAAAALLLLLLHVRAAVHPHALLALAPFVLSPFSVPGALLRWVIWIN